jgi:hypothetical protein
MIQGDDMFDWRLPLAISVRNWRFWNYNFGGDQPLSLVTILLTRLRNVFMVTSVAARKKNTKALGHES